MPPPTPTPIFIIGGTGAQGLPIVRALVQDRKYHAHILTRDPTSPRALSLLALGNVTLQTGSFASESDLRAGFRSCKGGAAFVNIDGFNSGEKTEIYWGIRAYELAIEEGVKMFVFGNLDYVLKKSGFDSKLRTGHYDGKGRVAEWILMQNERNKGRMRAAVFTTGPYIEMAISAMTIFTPTVEDGVVTWRLPLGEDGGGVVHVALEDCGFYVRWLFDHPHLSTGMDLQVGIEHVSYFELAKAFEKVTGRPARYIDTTLEEYWRTGNSKDAAARGAGYNSDPKDPSFLTFRENFTGFFNMWKNSVGNQGVIRRDYELMDEIHPGRVWTVEEWFRKEDEKGRKEGKGGLWERVQQKNLKPVLKIGEDRGRGKL